jgi:hypothetical protein
VEISEENLSKDHSDEILALLARLERSPVEQLEDEVAYSRDHVLCTPCRRHLVSLLRNFFQAPSQDSESSEKGTS